MKQQSFARPKWWFVLIGVAAVGAVAPLIAMAWQQRETPQSFDTLKPQPEIIYLLANSSVVVGPDVTGPSEEITFSGTVVVPKFPLAGFERRKLGDGKYQIDFELTRSDLHGESYLLDGPILLGEHPDLRSLGTITQREPGKDFPADFIVQRKVLIETPTGKLHNEAPVPVRGTIDSIPPVRQLGTPDNIDVFHGEQLPVAMLNESGEIGGWFYSKAHVAYAVNPSAVFRFNVAGKLAISVKGKQEEVDIDGPVEGVRLGSGASTVDEIISMGLRGNSSLLGGRVMLIEAFGDKDRLSRGRVPDPGRSDSTFQLYVDIKSPSGTLHMNKPLTLDGMVHDLKKVEDVALTGKTIPSYDAVVQYTSDKTNAVIVDELNRTIAEVRGLKFASAPPRRGPCCPKKPGQ